MSEPTAADPVEVGSLVLAADLDPAETVSSANFPAGSVGEVLEAELVEPDRELHSAELVELGPVDGEQLIEEWLDLKESPNTREAYARDIGYWLEYLDEHLDVDVMAARGRHVEQWQKWLRRTPLVATGKVPAPSTVRRRVEVVSSFYRWAVKREHLVRNPVDFVDRVKVDADYSDTTGLTEDEARRVIDEAFERARNPSRKGPDSRRVAERDALIVAVMVTTGLRTSEARAVRVEDLGYDRGYRVVRVTRKGGKRAWVALGRAAMLVDRYVQQRGWTSGPLFRTRSGAPVPRSWVFEALRRVAESAAVPNPERITPHGLRHTYVTTALDRGVALNDVQDGVGHADPRTTMRYDRNRNRLHNSPSHVVGDALLKPDADRTGYLPF